MGDRPSGTVTFLFTDIEGSTRLWQERPDEMRAALEEHDALLRAAIDASGGYVFATGGDGFAVAFHRTADAAEAASKAQAVLAEHPFLKVRMGIHTGEAQERDGDYFGPAVNKAARVMSAGHGGQILVSETARRILDRPTVDLGVHVLPDLSEPTAIHQLGEGRFPPLRAMTSANTNLRPQLSSFIGRDDEVERLRHMVADHRLVTLTGVGGVGKTRLAIQAAGQMAGQFPEGAWMVELAPVEREDEIDSTVATDLRIQARPNMSLRDSVVAALAARDQLLILDNCEHLLDATAELVEELLGRTPTLRVIATSREPLDIDGEYVIRLRSLATDGEGEPAALKLFVDRADAAGAEIGSGDLETASQICRMLDGIPLAIELAAARCRSLSPSDVLERLDERFRLLRAGRRGRVERHQTLRATVGWGYDLLTGDEQAVFEVLSVFVDGASLDAVEAVVADDVADPLEIPDLIDGLVRKSMIVVDPEQGSRYLLLETLRQFGLEKLAERGADAVATARRRHADHYLKRMKSVAGLDWDSDDDLADFANLRSALDMLTAEGRYGDAADLSEAMWFSAGWSAFARELSERMASIADLLDADDPRRSVLLAKAANDLVAVGLFEKGIELATRSLTEAEAYGIEPSANAYYALGFAHCLTGRTDEGLAAFDEGIARFPPDPTDLGVIFLYVARGGFGPPDDSPDAPMAQGLRMAEESGSKRALHSALLSRSGGVGGAQARADVEYVAGTSTDANLLIWARSGLGYIEASDGNYSAALDLHRSTIQMALEARNEHVLCTDVAAVALVAARLGVRSHIDDLYRTIKEMELRAGGTIRNMWSHDIGEIGIELDDMGIDIQGGRALDDRELRGAVNDVISAALELIE